MLGGVPAISRRALSVLRDLHTGAALHCRLQASLSSPRQGLSLPSSRRTFISSLPTSLSASATSLLRKSHKTQDAANSDTSLPRKSHSTQDTTNSQHLAWESVMDSLNAIPGESPSTSNLGSDEQAEANFADRTALGFMSTCTPTTGRSVPVLHEVGVAVAYRQLTSILRRNHVRDELRRGERYEKPNQMRRRKMSERHRRRFADMVRKKVQLVMAIRARGE